MVRSGMWCGREAGSRWEQSLGGRRGVRVGGEGGPGGCVGERKCCEDKQGEGAVVADVDCAEAQAWACCCCGW